MMKLTIINRKTRRFAKFCLIIVIILTLMKLQKTIMYLSNDSEKLQRNSDENGVKEFTGLENKLGNGEMGKPFIVPTDKEKEKDEFFKANGFNALASDYISLTRSLPDIRHKDCKHEKYSENLPSVSVVIPFFNEHLSVLLRTILTALNRSPENVIQEVILVDDASTKEPLKLKLDNYLKSHIPEGKVVRLPERSGLIRARLAGAKVATSDVIIFLDSHTEANVDWLPPLLDPIVKNPKACVCPFIDVIDYNNFEYRAQDEGARGSWDWEMYYKRLPLLPDDLKHPTKPFKSPVMAGGLFAIRRDFFWELGGYDEGLEIWGGEQYELSFKVWQCGGELLDAPCSRVGHIYRKFATFSAAGKGDFTGKNYKRVAEVWMDEYAEYIYKRRPHYRDLDPGDLSKQKQIRKDLNCKPFKWFMKNIAFDQPLIYPPIEPPNFGNGEIRSVADKNLCIDTKFKSSNERFGLEICLKENFQSGGEQSFDLTWHKDIRPHKRSVCWDVSSSDDRAPVLLWNCHGMGGNQMWKYFPEKKWLKANSRCLDCNPASKEIFVSNCDENSETQKWIVENVNLEQLNKWENPIGEFY